MNIVRLPDGVEPSKNVNRIHVWRAADRAFKWSGMIVSDKVVLFAGASVTHANRAKAEAEAIAWAVGHGAAVLTVQSTS